MLSYLAQAEHSTVFLEKIVHGQFRVLDPEASYDSKERCNEAIVLCRTRKMMKIYQKDAKINDFRGLQRGSARKRTETPRGAPQARSTSVAP